MFLDHVNWKEKVFQGAESLENKLNLVKSDLNKTDTQVTKMTNEVHNIDKEIKTQNTVINDQINAQKGSYSGALKNSRPTTSRNGANRQNLLTNNNNNNHNNNDISNNNNNYNNNINKNSANDGWQLVKKKRKALVGTGRPGAVGTKVMGAPPPSRCFVIERVLNEITGDDLMAHIKTKNSELEIRSLTCLSHEDSTYKKFKLEVSVLDCKVVYDPDFWQWGMRVRPYYRKKKER